MRAQQIWNCIYFEKYVGENGRYLLLKTDYRLLLFSFIKNTTNLMEYVMSPFSEIRRSLLGRVIE